MSTATHTPGPWKFDGGEVWAPQGRGPDHAANVCKMTGDSQSRAANASLIAAAPELLEALRRMVDMFERHLDGRVGPDDAAGRWDSARDAIAKAEGRA